MNDIRAHLADVDFSQDTETREARHELLASFLGAYADGELPAETQSQIDAHLTGCARCRRELDVHRAVRDRLGKEPVPAASAALRKRIAVGIAAAAPPMLVAAPELNESSAAVKRQFRRRWLAAGLAVPFVMIALLVAQSWNTRERAAQATIAQSRGAPLLSNVLADYRVVIAGDLPGRARDLAAVRAAVPFTFETLSSPSVRLVAAWTTSVSGEPAAVLAYRWNDRVVYQYFVSEALLFQSPEVRASLAQKHAVSHTYGGHNMLLWAEPEYGTVLVGEFQPEEFAALREASKDR
jgi:anti-sigma factor RsiW